MKRIFTLLLLGVVLFVTGANAATAFPNRSDFRDETIYFAMTTRFYDGDTSNNTYCWDGVNNVNDPEWRGDFKGLIEKLDYIKALGFTAIWITPVVENASGLDYHGYHAFNFSKVDPRYESQDCKFQDLIDAVHARGMKLILDIVLQHTGNFGENKLCPMFVKDYDQPLCNINKSIKLHPQSKLPANYFDLDADSQYANRLGLMKNTRDINQDTHNYWHHYAHFNWDDASRWWGQIAGDCVDLNTENPATTNYIVDCYSKFINMGVDGFRIDTSGHIARLTFNKAFIPQLHEAAEKAKAKRGGTPFYMFGEVCARAEEVIYRNGDYNCSPCFYTWAETKDYAWDYSETSWDNYVVMEGQTGDHVNAKSVLQQAADYAGQGNMLKSDNAWLNGNDYHAPDYSKSSNFNVIDFPMHWRFHRAENAFGVRSQDNLYNDATWNVVYVDGHDYGPNGWDTKSFGGTHAEWAENFALMFTWRGIPCVYQGSETYFRKGSLIDKGAIEPLRNTSRAYFGGYLTGSINTTDFAEYTNATGNLAATLSHPLALDLQRLNKIRAAVPALRKGQYSTDGCSGKLSFKRRYTDANTDSYCLVTISGSSTFTGILNGTYTDVVTGDTQTVTNGTLTANCSGQGNLRCYVLSTAKTPAPGKIGEDTKFIYASSPSTKAQLAYDGQEEAPETTTLRDNEDPTPIDPVDPVEPERYKGETCAFFHNTSGWSGTVKAWVWNGAVNYTGGTWPGQACTNLGNGYWKWSYGTNELPEGTQIIFSASGGQTKDLTFQNGAMYDASGNLEKILPEGGEGPITPVEPVEPDPVDPAETITIYFNNADTNWSTVNVHYWGASESKWPGVKMEVDEGNVYRYILPAGTTGIVFNNGNGTQSGDLVPIHNHIYTLAGDQGVYQSSGLIGFGAEYYAPIYFNLQGIRVEQPTPGAIYIVRRGNKVTKEIIR